MFVVVMEGILYCGLTMAKRVVVSTVALSARVLIGVFYKIQNKQS